MPNNASEKISNSIASAIEKLGDDQKESSANLAAAIASLADNKDKNSSTTITDISARMATLEKGLSEHMVGVSDLHKKVDMLIKVFVESNNNK